MIQRTVIVDPKETLQGQPMTDDDSSAEGLLSLDAKFPQPKKVFFWGGGDLSVFSWRAEGEFSEFSLDERGDFLT